VANDEDWEQRIRERAHKIWLEEGQPYGHCEEHWAHAKKQLAEEESAEPETKNIAPLCEISAMKLDNIPITVTALGVEDYSSDGKNIIISVGYEDTERKYSVPVECFYGQPYGHCEEHRAHAEKQLAEEENAEPETKNIAPPCEISAMNQDKIPSAVTALGVEDYSSDGKNIIILVRYEDTERKYAVPVECFYDLIVGLQGLATKSIKSIDTSIQPMVAPKSAEKIEG
jgi:hypothetical protein